MDISLSKVNKSFDKVPVIQNMSFTVHSGDIVGLLGPSGSGKTTIIRLIIGAIAADSGTIQFGETLAPNMKLLKDIGFMPQNDALYDDLTGEDNLRFFAALYGMNKKETDNRIAEVMALIGLSADRKKFVKHYSGGMKKRLSLAAALLHQPDVLLLDEPTVGIDPVLRRQIWDQFHKMNQEGKTLIISTHVMDEVSECGKAALIYNGKLIHYDTVQSLLSKTTGGRVEELFFMAAAEGGVAL